MGVDAHYIIKEYKVREITESALHYCPYIPMMLRSIVLYRRDRDFRGDWARTDLDTQPWIGIFENHRALDISEWCVTNLKKQWTISNIEFYQSTIIIEDEGDAAWFTLKWS